VPAAVIAGVLILASFAIVQPLTRRITGKSLSDIPPERRRVVWLIFGATAVVTAVTVWSFAAGYPAVGIGVLVGFYIVPHVVRVVVEVRRSRRRTRR
jgi:hypothetical protein